MSDVKLLWIDDMANWVKSAEENLQIIAKKHEVNLIIHHVENGEDEDIIMKMMMFDYDAVLMDYHMDPYNGDHYIEKIKEEEHLSYIPVYFYSQDPNTKLENLVENYSDVYTVFRDKLIDTIIETFIVH